MKKKAYIELGITLIVGFLIGFFVNSIITDKRIKEFSIQKGEWTFWRRALTEVGATNEQKQKIAPIIKAYTDDARQIMHDSWEEILPLMDEMENAILNELTEEQQRQIKQIQIERKKRRIENAKTRQNQERGPGQSPNKNQGREYHEQQRQGPKGDGEAKERAHQNEEMFND